MFLLSMNTGQIVSRFLLCALMLSSVPASAEAKQSSLRGIDFRNFRYPGFWSGSIRLRDGQLERESAHCLSKYSLDEVTYRDLTGDGQEEALVRLSDFTACGSSGVSHYFYIYTLRYGRLRLLWRFSTGSEGICGLRKFELQKKELLFELYGQCHIRGIKFGGGGVECCPTEYTRVRVAWSRHKFRQKSAKVFPV